MKIQEVLKGYNVGKEFYDVNFPNIVYVVVDAAPNGIKLQVKVSANDVMHYYNLCEILQTDFKEKERVPLHFTQIISNPMKYGCSKFIVKHSLVSNYVDNHSGTDLNKKEYISVLLNKLGYVLSGECILTILNEGEFYEVM